MSKPDKRAENESKELIIDFPQAWDIEPDKWPECCIYKVPPKLLKVNKDSYTPMIISIGPFHHGKENLKKMEELKRRYFMDACYQTMKNKNDLAKFIQVKEVEIRRCYAEILDFSSEDFVKMIASDSVFIIEHLWRTKQKLLKSSDSDGTSNSCKCTWRMEKEYPWLSYNILQDLILLKNQVPFFVVEELYNSAYHNLPYDDRRCQQNEDKSFPDRKFGKSIKRLPSVTKLPEAGVEFREVKNRHLLDIKFEKSRLLEKFPCLNLSWLISCFPCFNINLMALEQFHYPRKAYICNYIVLLDHLINTAEDVDLLVEKKVFVNWLGSNKAIHVDYTGSWNKLMASLKSQYFRDFWRGTTTFAGILVLFFAFWNFIRPFVFHR
ncbi:hypothetical protein RGQ29_017056 [Quercus rubra]|uniref:Uncharacterized protein n=1 Tax=Quercus rubra TaxID=3512 RepID=A0AAN7FG58_QUERU|nr:hypothetical protein RGQ29_017056 [Quercus rubra]